LCDETIWVDAAPQIRQDLKIQILCFGGFSAIDAMAGHVLQRVPGELVLAGHSMGGRVALEIVRQAPDRVTAIALLNTGVHLAMIPRQPRAAGWSTSQGGKVWKPSPRSGCLQ
jgi:pimeloyl-ACP methyl ester carboxylesterase